LGQGMAEVAGHDCGWGVYGLGDWEVGWRDGVQRKEHPI